MHCHWHPKQMTPHQEGGHAKQQHVDKVCCAKLKGDLLQLGAILYAACFTHPDQIPGTVKWSSSAGKRKQSEILWKQVGVRAHIHSTLSRKGKDGFPKKIKQVISLQICMADECLLQRPAVLPPFKVPNGLSSDYAEKRGCHLELSHYQWP